MKISNYLDVVLEDDGTAFGGVSFQGETVRDFINEVDLSENESLRKLNKALKETGIKKIKSRK